MPRRTPFHARTSALCTSQNWQEWSGFLSANSYEVVIARVKPQHGEPGSRVFVEETIEGQRFAIPAEVAKMPFFDPPRKKDTPS